MKRDLKNRTWSRKCPWWSKNYYRWPCMFITSAPRKGSRCMPHSGKGWAVRV